MAISIWFASGTVILFWFAFARRKRPNSLYEPFQDHATDQDIRTAIIERRSRQFGYVNPPEIPKVIELNDGSAPTPSYCSQFQRLNLAAPNATIRFNSLSTPSITVNKPLSVVACALVAFLLAIHFYPAQVSSVENIISYEIENIETPQVTLAQPENLSRIDTSALYAVVGSMTPAPTKPRSLSSLTGGLTVQSIPSGAEIYINGIDADQTTPAVVNVPKNNKFSVELKLNRYQHYNKSNLTLNLAKPILTAELQKAVIGYVDIDVKPPVDNNIYINNHELKNNELPISDFAIPANTPVTIRAVNDSNGSSAERTIRLSDNEHVAVILHLDDATQTAVTPL